MVLLAFAAEEALPRIQLALIHLISHEHVLLNVWSEVAPLIGFGKWVHLPLRHLLIKNVSLRWQVMLLDAKNVQDF